MEIQSFPDGKSLNGFGVSPFRPRPSCSLFGQQTYRGIGEDRRALSPFVVLPQLKRTRAQQQRISAKIEEVCHTTPVGAARDLGPRTSCKHQPHSLQRSPRRNAGISAGACGSNPYRASVPGAPTRICWTSFALNVPHGAQVSPGPGATLPTTVRNDAPFARCATNRTGLCCRSDDFKRPRVRGRDLQIKTHGPGFGSYFPQLPAL